MSQAIAIKFGRRNKTDVGLDASKKVELQRLEQERLELIQITNQLEALYARLLIVCETAR